jgi:hypothetical protein
MGSKPSFDRNVRPTDSVTNISSSANTIISSSNDPLWTAAAAPIVISDKDMSEDGVRFQQRPRPLFPIPPLTQYRKDIETRPSVWIIIIHLPSLALHSFNHSFIYHRILFQ